MLSKKAKYALKALILLAQNPVEAMIIADIATKQNIPKKFLEAILVELKKNGLLYSSRGRLGGYRLLKSPKDITIGQVIRIIDDPLVNPLCSSRQAYTPCIECIQEENCIIRLTMLKVQEATVKILDSTTLSDAVTYHMIQDYYR